MITQTSTGITVEKIEVKASEIIGLADNYSQVLLKFCSSQPEKMDEIWFCFAVKNGPLLEKLKALSS
jgi:hypothetical protein